MMVSRWTGLDIMRIMCTSLFGSRLNHDLKRAREISCGRGSIWIESIRGARLQVRALAPGRFGGEGGGCWGTPAGSPQ